MSIQSKFKTSKEAKNASWFSRRHETGREHSEVHERKMAKKKKKPAIKRL